MDLRHARAVLFSHLAKSIVKKNRRFGKHRGEICGDTNGERRSAIRLPMVFNVISVHFVSKMYRSGAARPLEYI